MPANEGISVVIPTAGRVKLVEALLASIAADALTCPFPVEIVLADSSFGPDREALSRLATEYRATLVPAPPPRPALARNIGAAHARFEFLLFIDSDTTLCIGTIQAHWQALRAGADACAGSVEFTGTKTFPWRVVETMQVMLPFRYPSICNAVPWAPTANLSFRKDRFLAIGGFDTELPHYGGEDVDLGFRFTDAGFRIQTSHSAVVRHNIETWARWSQNLPRLLSYGRADFYLIVRHPARTYLDLPSPLLTLIIEVLLAVVIAQSLGW